MLMLWMLMQYWLVVATNVMLGSNNASVGGGIDLLGGAQLSLVICLVEANDAEVMGGGIAVEDESVLRLYQRHNIIRRNNAAVSGGGVFAESKGFVVDDVRAATHNNTAKHDADFAVFPTNISIIGTTYVHDYVSRPAAGDGMLPVRVRVSGQHDLPCGGHLLGARLDDGYMLTVNASDSYGLVDMRLRIQKPPGLYNVTFDLFEFSSVPVAVMSVQVRACTRGEIAPSPDTCQVCLPGSYSLHPSQETCQPCPAAGATCPGGAAILPLPGWWHSTADLAQMHR
jgi:hypothetical protein